MVYKKYENCLLFWVICRLVKEGDANESWVKSCMGSDPY